MKEISKQADNIIKSFATNDKRQQQRTVDTARSRNPELREFIVNRVICIVLQDYDERGFFKTENPGKKEKAEFVFLKTNWKLIGTAALPLIANQLSSTNPILRETAAQALAKLAPASAAYINVLSPLLNDHVPSVCHAAREAMRLLKPA